MNLKNKGVLLSGIRRDKDYPSQYFFKELFLGWGWVVGEKKGVFPFSPFFSFLIIWLFNKDNFPQKIDVTPWIA